MMDNDIWMPINQQWPPIDAEYPDRSNHVVVSDGTSWGHGRYYRKHGYWVCNMIGLVEQDLTTITHWKPVTLPLIDKT